MSTPRQIELSLSDSGLKMGGSDNSSAQPQRKAFAFKLMENMAALQSIYFSVNRLKVFSSS